MADEDDRPGDTCINKLYLKGFKSFQRQTAIPFYPGMTAIVGTNGSGKSNIMDAMRFVMGKRSSQLRAEKLEQLIFNGGESRKPAEEAVVRLHLDNENGVFDEFVEEGNPDEVVVGRKITRNGYSTYRFQGSNCKRSKIDQVLDAAGVDDSGHHFVRQGRITQTVKQTPVERRKTIDRISGITSFDKKKEKAQEDLEEVHEKLSEFYIKKELKQDRLESLEEQKEAAEKYKELKEKKKQLKYSVLQNRKKELENQIEQLGEDDKEERIEELDEKVDELDDRLDELEEERDKVEDEISEEQDSNIIQEIERLKGKIERKKGKIENKREKIDNIESVLEDYDKLANYGGRNRAVKAVLNMDTDGVYGTVGQLLHYDQRVNVAIETALGAKIDNIVVDSRDTATKCINYLKDNNIGRATFLPLDKVSPRGKSSASKRAVKMAGVIDYAIDLVEYDDQYERAIKHVLGDTLVAEDLGSLKSAGRIRAVTLDGDIMRKGGSITGGKKKRSRRKRKQSSSINPEEKKKKKEQLEDEIEDLKDEIGRLNKILDEKKEEEEEQSQVSDDLKQQLDDVKDEIEETREERREAAEELKRLRNKIGNIQKKRAKFEAELENVEEDLNEFDDEYEVIDDSISNLKRKRTNTVKKINGLGNVNMRAIEEYEEFKEEYEEFREKLEKVKEEKEEIEGMIEEIEAKKKKKFMGTLEQVDDKFSEIFTTLFDGGEGSLELEEEGNIDSGLLIKAHPPDKEPHVIDSLSGGEKTLTAIAFIFAVQECKPSPFYLMDEIDAALDQTNSKQLSNLLRDYAEDSQLVLISHNEETVRHADRAYGVSMQDGVSKIRSIEL